jgi:hypothetical protein
MLPSIFARLGFIGVFPLIFLLSGCGGGDGVTVHGSVSFNGKPVEKGYINFHPTDKSGRSVGGAITDGKFSVKNVIAGKCRVEVMSTPATDTPESMDASIQAAKDVKARKEQAKELIAANSEGNNQIHEITSGTELTLALKTSDSSGPPPQFGPSSSMPPIKKK